MRVPTDVHLLKLTLIKFVAHMQRGGYESVGNKRRKEILPHRGMWEVSTMILLYIQRTIPPELHKGDHMTFATLVPDTYRF